MNKNKLIIIGGVVLFAAVIAVIFYFDKKENKTVTVYVDVPAAPEFQNGTYVIDGTPITLVKGMAVTSTAPDSESKKTVAYFGNKATGDFNNDGHDDVAFLLTVNEGGSGTFFYVVAALGGESGYKGTNAIFLGDRIAPNNTEFRDGDILVNYAERLPDEPMTESPSVAVSRHFHVDHGVLVETMVKK